MFFGVPESREPSYVQLVQKESMCFNPNLIKYFLYSRCLETLVKYLSSTDPGVIKLEVNLVFFAFSILKV